MAFKLLKRRYRSSEDDEALQRLDFFHHPYEHGNTIRLIDDVLLPKPVSMYSLSTQFVSLEDSKRGKQNVVKREEVQTNKQENFDPFDFGRSNNC